MNAEHSLAALPLTEAVREALDNLFAQRQRTVLALLGILIGTASIVAMLTIGHMAQLETLKLFRHLGVDMVQIHAEPVGDGPGVLDRRAIETLPAKNRDILAAAPLAIGSVDALAGARSASVTLIGATAELARLVTLEEADGRFLARVDDTDMVAVVGADAARKLAAPGAAIAPGSRLRIGGYVFTVIGVLEPIPVTSLDPTDINGGVIIPLGVFGRVTTPSGPVTALLHIRSGADLKSASAMAQAALANPGVQLEVISARDLIRTMNAQKAIHTRLLAGVGAISLFVGGIGVMNVMLMSVMERRREIGLRAAVGATRAELGRMFLIEAGALAGVGGLLGLAVGLAAAFVAAAASRWSFALDPWVLPLGPAMAALVGVAFGLHPAVKAARLDPIDALRAE
ncbi:MAG TPA: ABC transporter permease [Caulobacteraceae bacterium]|nr:ABC transporter permease [Caulobacteraceae bacterium]